MKIPILILATVTTACAGSRPYGQDLEFLRQHTPIIELKSGQAAVAVAPAFQGRVMTSTATGPEGSSFGWLNDKLIAQGILPEEKAAGKLESHIYVFGGEERVWLGPFYELETSSPAASLAPGKSITHRQTTVHISGPAAALDPVATAKLGVSIEQITGAFANK